MLSEKLKQFRNENRLTQVQLAHKLKIARSVISDIENKKRKGSLEFIKNLSEYSGKPISYWLDSELTNHNSKSNIVSLRELLNMLHYKNLDKEVKVKIGNDKYEIDCITENHRDVIYIKVKEKEDIDKSESSK